MPVQMHGCEFGLKPVELLLPCLMDSSLDQTFTVQLHMQVNLLDCIPF